MSKEPTLELDTAVFKVTLYDQEKSRAFYTLIVTKNSTDAWEIINRSHNVSNGTYMIRSIKRIMTAQGYILSVAKRALDLWIKEYYNTHPQPTAQPCGSEGWA